jgi:hypothetical protein
MCPESDSGTDRKLRISGEWLDVLIFYQWFWYR